MAETFFFQESGVHFWNMAPMIIKIFFCVFGSIRRDGTKTFWIFDHFWEIYGPLQKKNAIIQGHSRYNGRISDRGGQNHQKWPKKWCFLTSVTKRVLGIIKRLLEYDIEYYGTPSGNYGLVTTCPQHTSGGGQKNFLLIFWPKTWFFSMIFQKIGAREVKNCRKIEEKILPSL